jgi:transposase
VAGITLFVKNHLIFYKENCYQMMHIQNKECNELYTMLTNKEMSIGEIMQVFNVSVATAKRRISAIKKAGLKIKSKRILRYNKSLDTYSIWVYSASLKNDNIMTT